MKVFIKDGKVADIYGDEEHPVNKGSLCHKGLLSSFHAANPQRIVTPAIRDSRDQAFKKVAWDEALAFAAAKLQETAREHGPDCVFIHGRETAPFGHLLGAEGFAEGFATPNGPSAFLPPPLAGAGAVAEMFGVPASQLLMNAPRDWCNSRCIVVCGSDLAASDPMTFGPLVDARDRGAQLLVIDAKKTVTASKATRFLRIKPGGQATALKGIIRLLLEKGEGEEGFSELRSHVAAFTPERVAAACWVNREDLETAAGLIATNRPVQVIGGDWHSRGRLGDEELVLMGALVALLGCVGVPGGGLNLLGASPFAQGNGGPGLEDILLDPQRTLRALVCHGNPLAELADGNHTRAALAGVPLVVHLSSYADETYHHAHVSLPVAGWLEYSGLVAVGNGRALQWHNRAIDPPGDCRPPLDIWAGLAAACGLGDHVPWKDAGAAADAALAANPLTAAVRVADLDPETNPPGGVLWPCTDKADLEFEDSRYVKGDVRGRNILFQRRGGFSFPSTLPAAPDDEKPGDPRFPLMLITGPSADCIGEFGFYVSDRGSQAQPLTVQIHPRVGKHLGIATGDRVAVENARGSISGAAWLSEAVDPRVVWCPDGMDAHLPGFASASPRTLFAAGRPFAMVAVHPLRSDSEGAP